jgi:threonine synthase
MGNPEIKFPIFPPMLDDCPETSTDEVQYPLEIAYDYSNSVVAMFEQDPLPGFERWSSLLPPLLEGLRMCRL